MLDDSKSRICASCQDRVLQRDAKLELETLEGFGWFCSKCQQKATQRGAILLVTYVWTPQRQHPKLHAFGSDR